MSYPAPISYANEILMLPSLAFARRWKFNTRPFPTPGQTFLPPITLELESIAIKIECERSYILVAINPGTAQERRAGRCVVFNGAAHRPMTVRPMNRHVDPLQVHNAVGVASDTACPCSSKCASIGKRCSRSRAAELPRTDTQLSIKCLAIFAHRPAYWRLWRVWFER